MCVWITTATLMSERFYLQPKNCLIYYRNYIIYARAVNEIEKTVGKKEKKIISISLLIKIHTSAVQQGICTCVCPCTHFSFSPLSSFVLRPVHGVKLTLSYVDKKGWWFTCSASPWSSSWSILYTYIPV
jgi:hypothetical protein